MNDEPVDELEVELAGLRPQAVSQDVRRRVAERLNAPRWTWRRWGLTAAGAVAAGVAVLLAWPKDAPPKFHSEGPQFSKKHELKQMPPATLAEYRRAIDESPAALDRLMNQSAAVSLRESRVEVRAGFRLNEPFLDSLGVP